MDAFFTSNTNEATCNGVKVFSLYAVRWAPHMCIENPSSLAFSNYFCWWLQPTHLKKYASKIGSLPQIGMKIKHI